LVKLFRPSFLLVMFSYIPLFSEMLGEHHRARGSAHGATPSGLHPTVLPAQNFKNLRKILPATFILVLNYFGCEL
jgi:hypothetical protein